MTETQQQERVSPPVVRQILLSIVTPAFNEADNLPVLCERLGAVLAAMQVDWEWIIVDDHSTDATFTAITKLSARDPRIRGLRFARNSGSHAALACGLKECTGDCAVVMAADLQDPPETLPRLLEQWRGGYHVVWAARSARLGETKTRRASSWICYTIMRRFLGVRAIPPQGADFFLIDRSAIDGLNRFHESNVHLAILITWMGFRQTSIHYDKQPRLHGQSGWTLGRKIKLAVDSVTAFSYFPIRIMSLVGIIVAVLGFLYALYVIIHAALGKPMEGWSSLMVVVLVVGGIQMIMMGILGEYLWRTLDESRHRPRYLIESRTERRKP